MHEPDRVGQDLVLDLVAGERVAVEGLVALHTSRDRASDEGITEARTTLAVDLTPATRTV